MTLQLRETSDEQKLEEANREIERLKALINNPITDDFVEAVKIEAAHQVERWGVDHDAGKEPEDWFWLIGYLGGKVLRALKVGDTEKALHHTISTAAACRNWYAAIVGNPSAMRPGIEPPDEKPVASCGCKNCDQGSTRVSRYFSHLQNHVWVHNTPGGWTPCTSEAIG